ncbi:MAG: hypothetical protein JRN06_10825 [Nitrososphaerota archaeon]|nr:hypothetical protein [Nitrososphaerota archaeon]
MGPCRGEEPSEASGAAVLAGCAVVLLTPVASAAGPASRGPALTVHSDGYVHVDQALSVDPKASYVQVPLLSQAVPDLGATDQNGSLLCYGVPFASTMSAGSAPIVEAPELT